MKTSPGKINQLAIPFVIGTKAINHFGNASAETRGAVFTRREVVDFILDLSEYTTDRPLYKFRILEPSFGEGDFLLPIAERLLLSYEACVADNSNLVEDLSGAVRAVEVHPESLKGTRIKLIGLFKAHNISEKNAQQLLDAWLVEDDFLLANMPHKFTHAIGNPPYVRQELIPDELLAEYRARYTTIYDRADLYVPFIERCLTSLEPGGILGFICSDRWMKNRYGGPLRAMVAGHYHLSTYIDMVDTPAFHSDVIAYPAITIIKRERPGPTRIVYRPNINRRILKELSTALQAEVIPEGKGITEIPDVAKQREPWILQSFDQLAVVRRLEADFPLLEDAGCKIGIGVATGADKVFIGSFESLDVEPDRKLPLVGTKDIQSGTVEWQGLYVINPFRDDGRLVNLTHYPKLACYFESQAHILKKRNCAKKNPKGWFRTIDRIYPELTYQAKLLIPDIKGEAHVVYENGQFYPHHNLYFITSEEWDLRALQAVLRSGIAKLFVSIYSTKMRGGYLRFQAQYLRRIRLPRWKDVPQSIREALIGAANADDIKTCNHAVFELYQLGPDERAVFG